MARIKASLASFEKPDTMPPRLVKEMADAAQIQAEQEVECCRRNLAASESAYENAVARDL